MTSAETETVVDLGDMSEAPEIVDAAPVWSRWRWTRFAVPVLAVLLLLGAAGAPLRGSLIRVADVPGGAQTHVLIDGDRMFVDSYAIYNSIAAYGLMDGRQLWSATIHEIPDSSTMQLIGNTIVMTTYNADVDGVNTEAFDAATGRRLWSSPSVGAISAAGGVLMDTAVAQSDGSGPGFAYKADYQLVDVRSGAVRWSYSAPDDCTTAFGAPTEAEPPTVLVEVCDGKRVLRVIDLADARTLMERTVPLGQEVNQAQLAPDEVMAEPQVVVLNGIILVAHANVPTPTLDAYALDSLQPLWTGLPEQQGQDLEACGHLLCMYTASATGAIIDPATGHVIGSILPDASPTDTPSPKYDAIGKGTHGLVIVARADTDTPIPVDGNGPVWLATTSGLLIAPLPGAGPTSCIQITDYIACGTTDFRLRVWHLT